MSTASLYMCSKWDFDTVTSLDNNKHTWVILLPIFFSVDWSSRVMIMLWKRWRHSQEVSEWCTNPLLRMKWQQGDKPMTGEGYDRCRGTTHSPWSSRPLCSQPTTHPLGGGRGGGLDDMQKPKKWWEKQDGKTINSDKSANKMAVEERWVETEWKNMQNQTDMGDNIQSWAAGKI